MGVKFEEIDYQNKIKDVLEGLEKKIPNSFATKTPEIVEVTKLQEAMSRVRQEINDMGAQTGSLTDKRLIPINCRDSLVELIKNPTSGTLNIFIKKARIDYGKKVSETFEGWFDGVFTKKD